MSSSDSDAEDDFIFYRDREEWKDVTPIPQEDGPVPIVSIAYTDKFKDVYDYLRAMWKTDEKSERAFQLSADALQLNAANYTVWHFRRELLKHLNKDLSVELQYISNIIRKQPKNYQVWYHRGMVIKGMNDCSQELQFTKEMLQDDAKNYHCWQHRQLILNHFKLWEGEVDFTSDMLTEDLRNNSAWNQRYYAIKKTTKFTEEVISREVSYTMGMIDKAPNNESAWNFLKGVLTQATKLHTFTSLRDTFEDKLSNGVDSPYLLSFLFDFYNSEMEDGGEQVDAVRAKKRALELCNTLATEVDTIRKEYWNYEKRTVENKFSHIVVM